MWRAKQQEKNNAKFDNFAKEVSTVHIYQINRSEIFNKMQHVV
jgi:hypothetical protein